MKDITTEEAVKILKDIPFYEQVENYSVEGPRYILKTNNRLKQARNIVLNELEKKNKIIDAMTKYIEEINYIDIDDNSCEFETRHQIECPPTACKDCIKQYFEMEVKDV